MVMLKCPKSARVCKPKSKQKDEKREKLKSENVTCCVGFKQLQKVQIRKCKISCELKKI